ncbi:UDP-2,4-diacetamido-2,4,6-trideoxy-beta-L-altropyranose hydrolase [Methylomicrobium sp. Wu6]|uniref:UDP-2,4-diacetamido-2,4, 6-trideoxy-beta-L-altropyranose hydrolase n=1 Tax=Methylomicrobium sp. Wu6 TaxID=3107928 RepID=UPI002DD6519B|nr:UDP-2,4-diacetamido-2,4,6-trideoxy-beta-L-altropyranose hydrolase [Methylomicrobium sp. Wu6]MEC4747772.1 UDP-2,4-diacetamido-2,4,6-trideoxy-beta-L-altropyranose hydrolase [Methylomicrobium sp. Wu6]
MNIAFRADATSQIGTGHFMRCLTLADALKRKGAQIRFISRGLPSHLRDMLAAKGMELSLLSSNEGSSATDDLAHSHWLGTSQAQDAEATIQALSDQTWDWLIIDHYALDARWESAMRTSARQIMVIDDIADRSHDCDVLLDQNFYADMQTRYADKVPAHCQLLLGPRYALLRDEFRKLREQVRPRTGPVKRILVFFGGVDADNYTRLAIKALAEMGVEGLHVDVVIGAQHPCRAEIETNCASQGFVCHVQTNRMAELMAAADLAIGAGGSATWERCCLGLPALSICVADNQQQQIADAAQKGLLYAPAFDKDLAGVIKTHASALIENPYLRRLISDKAMKAVDGRGVSRIIGNLGCSGIAIRNAKEEDSPRLFEWRNHPSIRSVSRNADPISWENHQKWFSSVLASQDRVLLIGETDEVPVGVVRFDKREDCAEISIYLVPDSNHSGQGRNLLLSVEQWLIANRPDIHCIQANVLGGNEPSHRLFLGAGYRVENTNYLKKLN